MMTNEEIEQHNKRQIGSRPENDGRWFFYVSPWLAASMKEHGCSLEGYIITNQKLYVPPRNKNPIRKNHPRFARARRGS